jgi:hypothetical protein
MNEAFVAVIASLITGLCSLAGVYIANKKSQALIAYRIEQLEHKVDRHNNLIERTFRLEGRMTECEHDIRDLRSTGTSRA